VPHEAGNFDFVQHLNARAIPLPATLFGSAVQYQIALPFFAEKSKIPVQVVSRIVFPFNLIRRHAMNSRIFLCFAAMAGLMLGAQSALAASQAVREMAGIIVHLEHYPSSDEKGKLKSIADNMASTAQERVLARAIMNLKHKAADEDKDKLKQVMNDAAAPAEVRDLAGIILNMSHMPSAADKSKLEQMMK